MIDYGNLKGQELVDLAKETLSTSTIGCPVCQTQISGRNIFDINTNHEQAMGFLCPKCGISFNLFYMNKILKTLRGDK